MKHKLYIFSIGILFCLEAIALPCRSTAAEPEINLLKGSINSLRKENDLLKLQIDILNSRLESYKQEVASFKAKEKKAAASKDKPKEIVPPDTATTDKPKKANTAEITHYNLAYLYAQQVNFPAAIKEYKENDLLRLRIDMLNSRLESYKQEVAVLKAKEKEAAASKDKPKKATTAEITHYNLAYLYAQQGNFPAAIKEYLEELKNNPDDLNSRYNLGCLYAKTEKFTEAIKEFEAVLAKNPDDKEACFNLAVIYGKSLKDEEKAKEYQQRFENNASK